MVRPSEISLLNIFSAMPGNVRFGSKADICSAQADVRFVPKADILACAGRTFAAFIDLQSCPRGLAVPEQAVAVVSSEPGQISERVFSTLRF